MSSLPAAPSAVRGATLAPDEFASAVRAARALPKPEQLAAGDLRDAIERVAVLMDRRAAALERRADMLGARAQVHREDVRAAEDAAANEEQAVPPRLAEHDAELEALVRQIAGLGRGIAAGVSAVEQLRATTEAARAVGPATKRLQKVGARVGQLRSELDDLIAEQQALEQVIAWSRGATGRGALPTAVSIGDLRHRREDRVAGA